MKPQIGISENHLEQIIRLLSAGLADEVTLYIKTRKFHWNVSGDSFMELHKLFEHQYKELEESIDEVAERIGKLGGATIGTLQEYSELTQIKESPGKYPSQKEMIKELLADHETIIVQLRKNIDEISDKYKDAGTADFLTGLLKDHETIAWTLRRYVVSVGKRSIRLCAYVTGVGWRTNNYSRHVNS
jgi:starvation-inducible DNA-binding protein